MLRLLDNTQKKTAVVGGLFFVLPCGRMLERARRFERPTLTLARLCSTPELRPLPWVRREILIPGLPCKRKIGVNAKNLADHDGKSDPSRLRTMSRFIRHLSTICICLWASLVPHPGAGHDGPHGPDAIARVERAVASGRSLDVDLVITGLGAPLQLQDVWAPGADVRFDGPVSVGFAQDVTVSARLTFAGGPPSIFTLMLDFGVAGQGAVTVIPGF